MNLEPAEIILLLTYIAYYGILAIIIIIALFGVYILNKHGENRLVSFSISFIYIVIIFVLTVSGQSILASLSAINK